MFSVLDDYADEKDDTKRKTRNLSEKKRRDQFNTLVNELSSMVSVTSRKIDKSTVLRSTISFLKNYKEVSIRSKVHDICEDWKPSFLSNEEFMHLILEAFDGFIIVFSSAGRILYTSGNITSLLGYLPSDVLNMSIYDIMMEDDHSDLYNLFLNPPTVIDSVQDSLFTENQVRFRCHLKRGGLNYRDVIVYEHVQFTGYFRTEVKYEQMDESDKNDSTTSNSDTASKYIFVGTTRIQKPKLIREMSINGGKKSEFTSRHSLEWKFLFLDHRAPPIIGYLPLDVLGTSGYDYYHFDDLDQVAACHETLRHKGEGTSCYYRFLTKGQQWLWLQTRFYITYHQWTSKPEFIVCTHRVINYVDVVQQMRRNNGRVEDGEDIDNSADSVERQLNSASSMMITSPWSSQSSRSRIDGRPSPSSVSNFHQSYNNTYHAVSGDASSFNDTMSSISQQNIEPDSSLPIKSSPQHKPASTSSMQTPVSCVVVSMQSTYNPEQMPQFMPTYTISGSTPLTYPAPAETSSTLPESTGTFDGTTTDLNQATAQAILQSELQRKHEELQLIIGTQQDELRRVSEQLVMARYGIPIVDVAMPIDPLLAQKSAPSTIESNRCYSPDNNSDRLSACNEYQQHHDHAQSQQQQQQSHHQHQQNHQHQHQHQHKSDAQLHHHHHQQQHQSSTVTLSTTEGEILSYMQLQPVTSPDQYTQHVLQQCHPHDDCLTLSPDEGEAQPQFGRHEMDGEG